MSILSELLYIPLQAIAGLWVALLLLRAWATAVQAPMRQPLGEFIMRLTDFAVLPLRRWLRGGGKVDWACLLLAYLATLVFVTIGSLLFAGHMAKSSMAWSALVIFLRWGTYTLMGVLIAQAILSWTQSNPSASSFLNRLTDPLLAPLRRFIPMVGPVDLSPLVLILLAQMALVLIARLGYVI